MPLPLVGRDWDEGRYDDWMYDGVTEDMLNRGAGRELRQQPPKDTLPLQAPEELAQQPDTLGLQE